MVEGSALEMCGAVWKPSSRNPHEQALFLALGVRVSAIFRAVLSKFYPRALKISYTEEYPSGEGVALEMR